MYFCIMYAHVNINKYVYIYIYIHIDVYVVNYVKKFYTLYKYVTDFFDNEAKINTYIFDQSPS